MYPSVECVVKCRMGTKTQARKAGGLLRGCEIDVSKVVDVSACLRACGEWKAYGCVES